MKKRWNNHLRYPFSEWNKLSYKRMNRKVMKSSFYPRTCSICGKKLNNVSQFWRLCPSCHKFIREQRELELEKR